MPYDELLGWLSYFERRPIGWREDDRTFKLLQAQGVKEKPWGIFPSLNYIYNPNRNSKENTNIGATLIRSALFAKLQKAIGGDKIL